MDGYLDLEPHHSLFKELFRFNLRRSRMNHLAEENPWEEDLFEFDLGLACITRCFILSTVALKAFGCSISCGECLKRCSNLP